MKFLPALHGEKDDRLLWAEGLSWHMAVAIYKDSKQNLKILFIHVPNVIFFRNDCNIVSVYIWGNNIKNVGQTK